MKCEESVPNPHTCEVSVPNPNICEIMVAHVKNWCQLLTCVKNWYQIPIHVKIWYEIITDVKNWYLIVTDSSDKTAINLYYFLKYKIRCKGLSSILSFFRNEFWIIVRPEHKCKILFIIWHWLDPPLFNKVKFFSLALAYTECWYWYPRSNIV